MNIKSPSIQVNKNDCLYPSFNNILHVEIQQIIDNQPIFRADQIADALQSWYKLTNNPTIIQFVKGVYIEFKDDEPMQTHVRPSIFNSKEKAIVYEEVHKLVDKGVIQESFNERNEFISPIFLRPKPDGLHRTILNLKTFNEFVEYHHFKMDTLESAIRLIKPNCYMASIDLKDAYYTVAIAEEHQKIPKIFV